MRIVKRNLKTHAVNLSGVNEKKKKTLAEKHVGEIVVHLQSGERYCRVFPLYFFSVLRQWESWRSDSGSYGEAMPSSFTITFPVPKKQKRASLMCLLWSLFIWYYFLSTHTEYS